MDFLYAVLNNDLFALQEALMDEPEVDVNCVRMGSMTALHVAAEKGYSACVTILISAGANIDSRDEFGYTPLMNAVSSPCDVVVTKLLRARCDATLTNCHGDTALHLACKAACPDSNIVRKLIKVGCQTDALNHDGETPLSIAVEHGATDAVRDLLFSGPYIDPNEALSTCPTSLTCVHKSLKRGCFRIVHALWLAGYDTHSHVRQFFRSESHKSTQTESICNVERQHRQILLSEGSSPLSLECLCRNVVRSCVEDTRLVTSLGLPCKLREFLLFQDVYDPGESAGSGVRGYGLGGGT